VAERPGNHEVPAGASAGEIIDVRIEGLAPGGDAVGRQEGGAADGRATFVALAVPGERVRARVTRVKSRVAWAELVEITVPSANRVPAPCPLFGRCGGCQWQQVALPVQRAAKRQIVARALGLPDVTLTAPVENGLAYRDRAQLVVGSTGEIGFYARRSHTVVNVPRCLLFSPALDAALSAIRLSAPALVPGTEIDLQAGKEGVHVALRAPGGTLAHGRRAANLPGGTAADLLGQWRESGVVGLRVTDNARDEIVGAPDVDVSGGVPDEPSLRIPAGAFSQVGDAANRALTAVVLRAVGASPGAVLELHAGSGNFTRGLVARGTIVVACDADRAAVVRGRRNVATATWLYRPPDPADADTVVVDPPRDGLDPESLTAAVQARRRVVYVSCDPQTLGRDARRLGEAGFLLRGAVALDLMPHTFHVEVVATFDRPQGVP
jgi:23S rRNA (uracil1939-C5)-methyltransferase